MRLKTILCACRHNMPPPPASWQYPRIYSPGGGAVPACSLFKTSATSWTLTFWSWKWCPSHVWRGFCANFSFPRPLCSRIRPDVRHIQTDVRRQTKASLNASALWGRRHNDVMCIARVHMSTRMICAWMSMKLSMSTAFQIRNSGKTRLTFVSDPVRNAYSGCRLIPIHSVWYCVFCEKIYGGPASETDKKSGKVLGLVQFRSQQSMFSLDDIIWLTLSCAGMMTGKLKA